MKLNIKPYTLDGSGTEIDNFNVSDTYDEYLIKGTAIGVGNYNVSVTGTPQIGEFYRIKYKGTLDITTNGITFSILGQSFTQNQLNSDLDVECFYDGSAWEVQIKPSFTSAVVESSNLTANAVTASSIANGSITEPKLATNAVSATKIQSNAVTTAKINNLAVTDAKINDVDGSKIVDDTITTAKYQDDSVTNAKLSSMSNSSLKFGNNSGNPGDLVLGADEIAIGNGTTIIAINKSEIFKNDIVFFPIEISFESGEQCNNEVQIPFNFDIIYINTFVIKQIAATDIAEVYTKINGTNVTNGYIQWSPTTAINTQNSVIPTGNFSGVANSTISFVASKTTPGGKVRFSVWLKRT